MLARNTHLQHRYRIIRPLGKGGMGHVYEAIDDSVDSIVAIKETFADTDRLRRAFEREAKLLANLKHPVLPRVMHHFLEGSGQFLVMEFVEGLNLAELLKLRGSPFKYDDVLPLTDKLLSALEYLHGQSDPIIHRDIKPANIKVTGEGEVFLLDFGLAKGAPGHETSSVHGYTAAYAPLEQLNNSGTTEQSDLYSLGATLYHMLTAHLPAQASQRYKIIEDEGQDPLIPIQQLNPEVPAALSAIISQAMAMKRRDRFASATRMREVLREATLAIEREREQRILDTPTLLNETAQAAPLPTEPADIVGLQLKGIPIDPGQNHSNKDSYLKTIPAKPPIVPPPPIDAFQPSWPSQIDSEPSDMTEEANRRKAQEEERLNREAEEERHLREEQERPKREEEARRHRQTADDAARHAENEARRKAEDEEASKPSEADAEKRRAEGYASVEEARRRAARKRSIIIGAAILTVILGGFLLVSLLSQSAVPDVTSRVQSLPNQQAKEGGDLPVAPAGMAYVPGGEFPMGRDDGDEYERPAHKVTVKPFLIDLYEVTCEEYAKFVKAAGHPAPPGWRNGNYPTGSARKPVTGVTWDDANAYANWAGKRLPTEEEWEFAARGTDGRRYPWGNNWQQGMANANGASAGIVDVGTYKGASTFGAFDMVGNVWEWTASPMKAYPGGQLPPQKSLDLRVIRGGTFESNEAQATSTFRVGWPARGGTTYQTTGFRCVKDAGN